MDIKNPKSNVEKPSIEPLDIHSKQVTASVCCGCVCVDKCFWNSAVAMKNLSELVNKKQVELPSQIAHLIEVELKEGK